MRLCHTRSIQGLGEELAVSVEGWMVGSLGLRGLGRSVAALIPAHGSVRAAVDSAHTTGVTVFPQYFISGHRHLNFKCFYVL